MKSSHLRFIFWRIISFSFASPLLVLIDHLQLPRNVFVPGFHSCRHPPERYTRGQQGREGGVSRWDTGTWPEGLRGGAGTRGKERVRQEEEHERQAGGCIRLPGQRAKTRLEQGCAAGAGSQARPAGSFSPGRGEKKRGFCGSPDAAQAVSSASAQGGRLTEHAGHWPPFSTEARVCSSVHGYSALGRCHNS